MSGVENEAFMAEMEEIPANNKSSPEIPAKSKITELQGIENGGQARRDEESDKLPTRNPGCLSTGSAAIGSIISNNPKIVKIVWIVILNAAVFTHFGFATRHWWNTSKVFEGAWCDGYGFLVILLVTVYSSLFYYHVVKKYFGETIVKSCSPVTESWKRFIQIRIVERFGMPLFYVLVLAAITVFMIVDTVDSRDRLMSLLGAVILIALGWIFSKHPAYIDWRPVIWGLILQFVFGMFTIRWSVGRSILQCVADKVTTFLTYASEGAEFVFSETLVSDYQVFAFASLSVIFFFSFFVQVLYYLGAMQWVIMKMGGLLQAIMGTTVCESINTVANIFLSMSESPLLIKPYVPLLTSSEIHTVMASGFASVSGTVLAAYIAFGAEPAHLITASLMSAPASLCYSKLFYPETEKSKTTRENIVMMKSEDSSILDAASKGALAGIPIVLGVIANVIAFVSAVAFLNGVTSWLGVLVGYDYINFEWFLGKGFMPLAWVMGVPWDECETVASLIGLKTVVNEFVAYERLGVYKNLNMLTPRTEAIATYALCGFSNPGSIGIMIGSLASMAPEKRPQIASVAIRAFFTGSAVCFLTACIAGMLMTDDFYASISSTNATLTS